MSPEAKPRRGARNGAPWGRLLLGAVGGYAATTLVLAAVTALPVSSRGEWVNWALILAPVLAVMVFAYAFAARSLLRAAMVLAAIMAFSAIVYLAAKLVI